MKYLFAFIAIIFYAISTYFIIEIFDLGFWSSILWGAVTFPLYIFWCLFLYSVYDGFKGDKNSNSDVIYIRSYLISWKDDE